MLSGSGLGTSCYRPPLHYSDSLMSQVSNVLTASWKWQWICISFFFFLKATGGFVRQTEVFSATVDSEVVISIHHIAFLL